MEIKPGLSGRVTWVVTEDMTAARMKSGAVDVFATPALIAAMECAACEAVAAALPEGCISVGTRVDIRHLAPTPVGGRVTAVATLTHVNRNRLVFDVEARDDTDVIGRGTHERFIVNREDFLARARHRAAP